MSNTEMDAIELRELLAAGLDMATPVPPPLESILSRGRKHQRYRRGAAAAAMCGLALVAGATLTLGSAGNSRGRSGATAADSSSFRLRTAAYTIVSHADGTATMTIDPSQLFDAAAMQHDLSVAGIPALVTSGEFCTSDPPPAPLSQVVTFAVTNNGGPDQPDAGGSSTITIDPGALPPGTELSIGDTPVHDAEYVGVRLVSLGLIDTNDHACSVRAALDPPTSSPADALRFVGIPKQSSAG